MFNGLNLRNETSLELFVEIPLKRTGLLLWDVEVKKLRKTAHLLWALNGARLSTR
ncbi:hypothetical protein SAMN05428947_101315 [Mucilaginibacter sp. OK283]|jgi:hypothetical protein|nr:hypothetical protein SAMN05428947_101315 [Mucilaginibacter sp. OK283]